MADDNRPEESVNGVEEGREEMANLDSTVIAVPLLRKLKELEKRVEEAEEQPQEPEALEVIIEINLMHPSGRDKTKDLAFDLVRKSTDEVYRDSDVDKYIFAKLTPGQLRAVARANEKRGDKGEPRWRHRPIYKIWPDFAVDMLLTESVGTVKADAARSAFAADGRGVVWAVVDSGIDGKHRHFQKYGNLDLDDPLEHHDFSDYKPEKLGNTGNPEKGGGPVDPNGHGTHVAGIIAGELAREDQKDKPAELVRRNRNEDNEVFTEKVKLKDGIRGVAPKCKLISLKVTDAKGKIRARSILAALGYVRRINGDGRLPKIHGVNISLGHSFDPEWFACGQSPLCVEVDRLVRTGTVVVVAAGNGGYGTLDTQYKGQMQAGLGGTIRDPGNAHLAITVGATHRDMPHVYGVSYFSAKGPTGDGRLKPDLVAPGEKIISCAAEVRQKAHGAEYAEDSGTSMATPHVSGCIAAFLSIRREFKNQPERVREIFLSTATDLGRERYYQGQGLVDLMRAIQSV